MNSSSTRTRRRSPPKPRAASRRDEARLLFRNAILEAAEQVFSERGFHAARIQDIAKRARVGVGTVYNHFEQKEDVLRALLDDRTEEMLALLAAHRGDPIRFSERLHVRIERLLAYVEQHRGWFLILLSFGIAPQMPDETARELAGKSIKRIQRMRAAFRDIVEEGIASGDLEEMDPADLAAFLGGTIRAMTYRMLLEGKGPLVAQAALIARLFLHGAGRASGKPAGAR
jgi:AcrR family transcriptional regulator